ncbi:MAG: hypothetical protein ACPIAA_06520, partial [Flavobacteriaceae bacterium]
HRSQLNFEIGERIIGLTVLCGAFIFMPLFLYHRWKGKQLKDYTLSEENLKKNEGRGISLKKCLLSLNGRSFFGNN